MFQKNHLIWWVLFFAAAIRLTVLSVYGLNLTLHSDDEGYIRSAIRLLESGMLTYHSPTEPTVHIMPGQPFLLAAVFFIFGSETIGLYAAKIVMIAIGIAGIYGLYLIGKVLGGTGTGLLAASLFAISVPHILTDNLLLTETPFTTSLIYLIYFSIKLANNPKMSHFYCLLLFYMTCLMFRPTIAFYPLILFSYLLLKKYPVKLMFKQAAIAVAILLVILGPWWIRNYNYYHEFIPLTGGSGNPLLLGTYQGQAYPNNESLEALLKRLVYPSSDAFTIMKVQEKVAKERIHTWSEADRNSFIRSYAYLKPIILWEKSFYWIEIFDIKESQLNQIQPIVVKAGIIGFLISLVVCSRHRKELLLVSGVLLYFTILYSAYFVISRYNEPLMPFIFLGIGVGVYSIIKTITRLISGKILAGK